MRTRFTCAGLLLLAAIIGLWAPVESQTGVANSAAQLSGKFLMTREDAETVTGLKTFDRDPSPPFAVTASSAKVTNLDADLLDGVEEAAFARLAQAEAVTGGWSFTTALTTFTAAVQVGDLRGTVQTTSSTGTQNDFSVTSTTTILRCDNTTDLFLTGLTGGTTGRVLLVMAINTGAVRIGHEETGSTAANRVAGSGSARGQIVGQGGAMLLTYDGTSSRWRLDLLDAGNPIVPTFDAADFSGTGAAWGVDAGDVSTLTYQQRHKTVTVTFFINTTDVTAGSNGLQIENDQWGEFTAARNTAQSVTYGDASATTFLQGFAQIAAAGTLVQIFKDVNTNWTATAADNTYVRGQITFEVQ